LTADECTKKGKAVLTNQLVTTAC